MTDEPRVSRLPVVVLIVGLSLAISLVILGADLAARPVESPPLGTPGVAASPRVVTIIMRDYRFDPTPLYLYRNETVRINVVNAGMVEHELVLGDAAVQSAWASADAAATPPAPFTTAPPASAPADTGGLRVLVLSGASTSVGFTVPEGGELLLLCNIPGHEQRGMVGEVVLNER
ncbi:MAG TPA: hypothetical protein VM284_06780 [Candidatus Limnocylindria bacterium]|nr:hypothetical protein [Candidatus Limnocylindria bacterium]